MNCGTLSLNSEDKKLIFYLSGDLGDGLRPYAALARKMDWTEERVLARLKDFQDHGLVRRLGATLWHQKSGFVANAMTVWQIEEERAVAAGEALAGLSYVSHCYLRETAPIWPYNLYAMIHAQSRERLWEMVSEMRRLAGSEKVKVLESEKELKKTSLRYFSQ